MLEQLVLFLAVCNPEDGWNQCVQNVELKTNSWMNRRMKHESLF